MSEETLKSVEVRNRINIESLEPLRNLSDQDSMVLEIILQMQKNDSLHLEILRSLSQGPQRSEQSVSEEVEVEVEVESSSSLSGSLDELEDVAEGEYEGSFLEQLSAIVDSLDGMVGDDVLKDIKNDLFQTPPSSPDYWIRRLHDGDDFGQPEVARKLAFLCAGHSEELEEHGVPGVACALHRIGETERGLILVDELRMLWSSAGLGEKLINLFEAICHEQAVSDIEFMPSEALRTLGNDIISYRGDGYQYSGSTIDYKKLKKEFDDDENLVFRHELDIVNDEEIEAAAIILSRQSANDSGSYILDVELYKDNDYQEIGYFHENFGHFDLESGCGEGLVSAVETYMQEGGEIAPSLLLGDLEIELFRLVSLYTDEVDWAMQMADVIQMKLACLKEYRFHSRFFVALCSTEMAPLGPIKDEFGQLLVARLLENFFEPAEDRWPWLLFVLEHRGFIVLQDVVSAEQVADLFERALDQMNEDDIANRKDLGEMAEEVGGSVVLDVRGLRIRKWSYTFNERIYNQMVDVLEEHAPEDYFYEVAVYCREVLRDDHKAAQLFYRFEEQMRANAVAQERDLGWLDALAD